MRRSWNYVTPADPMARSTCCSNADQVLETVGVIHRRRTRRRPDLGVRLWPPPTSALSCSGGSRRQRPRGEVPADVLGGAGLAEVVPLDHRAPRLGEQLHLRDRLRTFCDDVEVQGLSDPDDRSHQGDGSVILSEWSDEASIDLEDVDRKIPQVGERRVRSRSRRSQSGFRAP